MKPVMTPTDDSARQAVIADRSANLVVEAGAGTGKTTLLVERLLKSAEQHEVHRLVAITFTELAAAELLDRFRRCLEDKLSRPAGVSARLINVLSELDFAHISTIHSFATAMLRECPVEVGLDPEFQHLDEADEAELVKDALAERLEARDRQTLAVLENFAERGGDLNTLPEVLVEVYRHRDLIIPTGSADQEPPPPVETFRHRLEDLRRLCTLYCTDPADRACKRITQLCASAPVTPHQDPLAWVGEVSKIKRGEGNQNNWTDKTQLKWVKDELTALKSEAKEFLAALGAYHAEAVAGILAQIVRSVDSSKRARSLVSFQDQLLLAVELLKRPEVLARYRERFESISIDEFQDTDPLQMEIARRLAGDQPGRLVVLGDPKQSIYRFRRADPITYSRTTEAIAERGRKIPISQNFRSSAGIIKFVNAFFAEIWDEPTGGGIPYTPIDPLADRPSPPPAPPVTLITPPPEYFEGRKPKVGEVRRLEAEFLAEFAQRILGEDWQVLDPDGSVRCARPGDIAVLMPTMTDLDLYLSAFRARGFKCLTSSGRFAYSHPMVRDLYHCLTAIDNPADLGATAAALRSAFFGVTDAALHRWLAETGGDYRLHRPTGSLELDLALELLAELHDRHRELSAEAVIRCLLDRTWGHGTELVWESDGADPRLLEWILQQAHDFGAEHGTGLRGFRRRLETMMEPDAGVQVPPPPPEPDAVRFLTIHSSKGLEFPIVILANLGTAPGRRGHVLADRSAGRVEINFGKSDHGIRFATSDWDLAEQADKYASAAERLRLLYVGMTRARDHLVLSRIASPNPNSDFITWIDQFNASSAGAPNGLWRLVTAHRPARFVPDSAPPEVPEGSLAQLKAEVEAVLQERRRRLEQMNAAAVQPVIPSRHLGAEPAAIAEDDHARRVGSAVHRYLALCPPDADLHADLLELVCREEHVDPKKVEPLVRSCLESPVWKWAVGARRRWRESALHVWEDRKYLRGAVDLAWERPDGRLELADWKTGDPAPGHREQIRCYRDGLRRATGKEVVRMHLFYARDRHLVTLD